MASGKDELTRDDLVRELDRLDHELQNREKYLGIRRSCIDSLAGLTTDASLLPSPRAEAMLNLGDALNSFDSEWALKVYHDGYRFARDNGLSDACKTFQLRIATFLPLSGYIEEAIARYCSIDTTGMSLERKVDYFDAGRQMYSYIAAYHSQQTEESDRYMQLSRQAQKELLPLLDPSTVKYKLNLGEYYFFEDKHIKAEAILTDLINNLDESDNIYARACHILAYIAKPKGKILEHIYLLTRSAIADTKAATREVASLQELGSALFYYDDVERAHNYLSTALRNAVECKASLRMIQSAQMIPIIEQAHQSQLTKSRYITYGVIVLLAIILLLLIFTMWT
ncbi:MAG: hypothetical protein K2H98_05630, partial [Duncaniella sp.]|nr:hypothetical protein [Duncaniella sp.]